MGMTAALLFSLARVEKGWFGIHAESESVLDSTRSYLVFKNDKFSNTLHNFVGIFHDKEKDTKEGKCYLEPPSHHPF